MNNNKDMRGLFEDSMQENTQKHQEELFKDEKIKQILEQIEKELQAYVSLLREQDKNSKQKQSKESVSKQPENVEDVEHVERNGLFYEVSFEN